MTKNCGILYQRLKASLEDNAVSGRVASHPSVHLALLGWHT
ncbi:hypothetical protein [Desulfitobacterium metallireducens]|uniref:Uncharacterized protein n=1 Tax=Desulfitobacterium metallireducens DSM 15288 TaxID=871968 RepID=W0EGK1_9FIRM|nr:hypothetical protein [Desulfitobacterium metallireducens]AHF08648.1 hypothetical protein DESME_12045 [Desulfitobacterium metallireducens DSM 15288]